MDVEDLIDVGKSVYSLVLVLILWEVVAQLGLVHHYFLPPLSEVLLTFYNLVVSGKMLIAAYLTLKRAFIGLAIASVVGVLVGILTARNDVADWFFDPIITIGYPVPKIALVPVFMLWFGIGDVSKILLVALDCFFPIAVNTRDGAEEVDEDLIWSARMMGTSDKRLLRKVVLPAAAPEILTGIQVAMPISLIVAFVFEMVAGGGGLGALEIQGVRNFDSPQVYAVLIAIMLIGLVLDRGLRRVRARLLEWT